jgi:hypothetical protein
VQFWLEKHLYHTHPSHCTPKNRYYKIDNSYKLVLTLAK